jgi:hypothetical protein
MYRMTHTVVFLTVALGHSSTLVAQILLERRIDNELLTHRMPSKLPRELISKSCLVVMIVRVDHFIVVLLQLPMVFGDCRRYCRHSCDPCAAGPWLYLQAQ